MATKNRKSCGEKLSCNKSVRMRYNRIFFKWLSTGNKIGIMPVDVK